MSMTQMNNNKTHKPLIMDLSPEVNNALEVDKRSIGSCESLDVSNSMCFHN